MENKKSILINYFTNFSQSYSIESFKELHILCNQIAAENQISNMCELGEFRNSLQHLKSEQESFAAFIKNCSVQNLGKSFNEDLLLARTCVSLSKVNDEKADIYLQKIDSLERNEGEHTHHFVLVINELLRLNSLAVGSLILAIIIDVLILLCSLLGARHESFLEVDSFKDLIDMKDYPLEVILSSNFDSDEKDNAMIARMKLILKSAEFNRDSAGEGFPAVLSNEMVRTLGLHKELGVLLSMKLAMVQDDGSVGLKTKFILYMCDQITRKKSSNKTYQDFKNFMENEK